MPHVTVPTAGARLDDYVEAYEAARARDGSAALEPFLPRDNDPLYLSVLCEFVRIEMEAGWEEGRPRRLAEYRTRFPALFQDRASLQAIAFEEYRLRCQAGETPTPAEYERNFGLDLRDWPRDLAPPATQPLRPSENLRAGNLSLSWEAAPPPGGPRTLPQVGDECLGFRLTGLLGSGTFARVYLAEQADLAGRHVALKLTLGRAIREPQTLARMQHTNIVPIYSVHTAGDVTAVCMPFLGGTTLAHVLQALRGHASWPDSGKSLVDTLHAARSTTHEPQDLRLPSRLTEPTSESLPRKILEGLSYVEAVLWIGARLADGLAHAHERGILHRDLKPANVLLADDGQPMLLDFNLAQDTSEREPTRIGGTLPYMAPEHIQAFQGGSAIVDGRSDLYALGVILFELLTGRHPFPTHSGSVLMAVPLMLADRLRPAPLLRPLNLHISPAVEAMIRKCLECDPASRYQSAQELKEDLERHLQHQELKHASEPSWRERWAKFRRRHPRLASGGTVAVFAALMLLVAAGALVSVERRRARLEKEVAQQQQREDAQVLRRYVSRELKTIQYLLNARGSEPERLEEGCNKAELLLLECDADRNPRWLTRPLATALPEDQREALREDVLELHLLLSRSRMAQARQQEGGARHKLAKEAVVWMDRAMALAGDQVPGAIWAHQADLYAFLDVPGGSRHARQRAETTPMDRPRDAYLRGAALAATGKYAEALEPLALATQRDPRLFRAWFLRGYCLAALGREDEAISCYNPCTALDQGDSYCYFNRGLALAQRQRHKEALKDFDRVAELRPESPEAYASRALIREALKDDKGAIEDLTKALSLQAKDTRIYFLRARMRARLGDAEGAAADRAEGLRREPTDELSCLERGLARAATDPQGALADFRQALRYNPRSVAAWQDQAWVLDEKLNQPDASINALTRALELAPGSVAARGGRAVLLARQGKRSEAQRDAEECLLRDRQPPTLYQIAGVYALTSQREPKDRARALELLAAALRQGYGLDLITEDRDLDSLRNDGEFRRIVEAARVLGPGR